MNNNPLVSIITPFLNAEEFFVEAIESVIAQTYDNWELLLVDDGSTDESTAIAKKYAELYPGKIYYLEHPNHQNLGKSSSRNLGIANVKGKYIALLDADDIFLPEKLEKQVAILEAHSQAAMVYGPTEYWYSWEGNSQEAKPRDFLTNLGVAPDTLHPPVTLVTKYLQDGGVVPCTCGLLLRSDVVKSLGSFDESIQHMYEDQILIFKVCLNSAVFVESGCHDKYRQHIKSSSHIAINSGEYHPTRPNVSRKIFLNWLEKYVSEKRVNDKQLWQALRESLIPYRHPLFYLIHKSRSIKNMKSVLKSIAKKILPTTMRSSLGTLVLGEKYNPPQGKVNFGDLRRVTPINRKFGYDRGTPVDRYYIEKFLAQYASDIQGRVLEIGDNSYTKQFGGIAVTVSDVLHVHSENPQATIIGDLTNADNIPSNTFDCLVLTQTLHIIYDIRPALATIHRILKPGGVVLLTVPGISQISDDEWADYWCWSFTNLSIRRLFYEFFPDSNIEVAAHGNVLAATAFLQGITTEELQPQELDYHDAQYEMLICVRAVKPEVTV